MIWSDTYNIYFVSTWSADEFRRLQLIPNARVPILKLESHHRNISCDISIDNMAGQMKSKFFCWINEIDGRFRDMVLLVRSSGKAAAAF